MKLSVHLGMTMSLLAVGKFYQGGEANWQIVAATVAAGVFIDADKAVEVLINKIKKNKK